VGLERRTLPGETGADVERELERLLQRCRVADPELLVTQRTLLVRKPFEISRDAELVHATSAAAAAVTGAAPTIAGASYWADAAFIAAAGIPTVMLGPGGAGAHALEEWVSLSDTEALTRTLIGVAQRICG
jgi:acetylornithine deacetylase